jgi:hypothetical protein
LKDFKFFVDFDLSNHEQKWNFKAYAELALQIFFGSHPACEKLFFAHAQRAGNIFLWRLSNRKQDF